MGKPPFSSVNYGVQLDQSNGLLRLLLRTDKENPSRNMMFFRHA